MASSPIFNLPTEIIYLIVDSIDKFKDRRKLLQVCRHWRSLLLTKVYSKVSLDYDEKSLVPLAHIIHMNPLIRSAIRELRIPTLFYYVNDHVKHYNFQELIKPLPVTQEDLTFDHNIEVWCLIFIISSIENLRYLEICHYALSFLEDAMPIMEQLISIPVYGHTPLERLEEINIVSDTISENFHAPQFAMFFNLPSMRVFRAVLHEEHDEEGPTRSIVRLHPRPKHSPIRQIVLKHSNCQFGMAEYISSCANLEYFEYQHTNSVNDRGKRLWFRPRPFRTPLLTQKHCLRVLRLNDCGATKGRGDAGPGDDTHYSGDSEVIERLFGSLVEFTALRELRIPVRNLLDLGSQNALACSLEDILPRSLEYLCLARTDQAEFDIVNSQLQSLLAMQGERFPSFRKLVIQVYQMELGSVTDTAWFLGLHRCRIPNPTKEAFEDVRKMCEAKCIEFSFAHDGDYQIVAEGRLIHDTRVMPYCSHDLIEPLGHL